MNRSPDIRSGAAARRPWPFGPPLRGRAPRSGTGPLAAPGQGRSLCSQSGYVCYSTHQALAPIGSLPWAHSIRSVQR